MYNKLYNTYKNNKFLDRVWFVFAHLEKVAYLIPSRLHVLCGGLKDRANKRRHWPSFDHLWLNYELSEMVNNIVSKTLKPSLNLILCSPTQQQFVNQMRAIFSIFPFFRITGLHALYYCIIHTSIILYNC